MSKYDNKINKLMKKYPGVEEFTDKLDELLGGEGDHQQGETCDKARLAILHLSDRIIHSDGLRRAINNDLKGDSTNEDYAEELLYYTLLIGHIEKDTLDKVFNALSEDKEAYEDDEDDEDDEE